MFEWPEELQMVRDAVRQFVDNEIRPHREELEHGDLPPYDLLRKLYKTFGMDQMAADGFDKRIAAEEEAASGRGAGTPPRSERDSENGGGGAGFALLPIIELCKCSPGMVTAMGVSVGLTAAAINAKGTIAQRKRWARDIVTMEKIGAWAITEPNSGSDAFGQMTSTARRDGDEYVLNGSKTFITNGPYADTVVFICKLDEGNPPAERTVLQFVLDSGMPGFEQSKPLRKMGLHSSPTGMLFLDDVRVGKDRLLGESEDVFRGSGGREASKATFVMERSGVAAMALGIIERCLEKCVEYSKERQQFGRPIGDYQLIQLKLAKMEVARLNVENLVFRVLESSQAGKPMTLSQASAMKLYSAGAATEVALEAVQLYGGNGYMAEYEVEQLARDAKVLQIYAGTDEIQVGQIARALLAQIRSVPVEPPPNVWDFPDADAAEGDDEIIAVGADLHPGTLLAAYRKGLFPMYAGRSLAWWSPDPRGVMPLDGFHCSRSLRRALGGFEIRIDTAFVDVMLACGDERRPHGWINAHFVDAYTRLHDMGWVHSVETWQDGALVGGLYGIRIGRFFAGESMFHHIANASKVACWATVELLKLDRATLFDVQWTTPHLRSLGAVDLDRRDYLRLLASACMEPVQIFHNPSCSKSRGALEILQERGVDANVVRYLDAPPDRATLERILDAIPEEPIALVRTGDPKFKAAGLTKNDVQTRAQVIDVLLKHPEVMERPVVFVGDRAVIARPSEKVLDLLA